MAAICFTPPRVAAAAAGSVYDGPGRPLVTLWPFGAFRSYGPLRPSFPLRSRFPLWAVVPFGALRPRSALRCGHWPHIGNAQLGHAIPVRRAAPLGVDQRHSVFPVRLRLEVARLIASAGSYPDIDCSIHRRSALPAPYVDAPSLEYGDWFSRAVPPLILAVKLGRGLDLPAGHADELVSSVSSPHGDHLALLPPYQGHPEGYVLRSAQRGGGDDHIRLSGIAAGKAMGHIPANGLRTKGHHSPSFPALWGLRAA